MVMWERMHQFRVYIVSTVQMRLAFLAVVSGGKVFVDSVESYRLRPRCAVFLCYTGLEERVLLSQWCGQFECLQWFRGCSVADALHLLSYARRSVR